MHKQSASCLRPIEPIVLSIVSFTLCPPTVRVSDGKRAPNSTEVLLVVASRILGDYTTRAILSTGSASQRECMHPNVSDPPYSLAHAKRTLRIPLRRNSQARICGRITTTRRFNAIGVSQKTRPLLLLSSRDITHHHSPSSPLLIPATVIRLIRCTYETD